MAVTIGSLLIKLGLDSGQFKSGLEVSERELKKSVKRIEGIGKSLQGLGTKLTIGVTAPLAALAKASVDGFVEQEKAMADVNAALKSMGGAAGRTGEQLLKAADAMELQSLFDAEVILKQVTANLLTFGNVAGREFDRAQQAAVDMATRLGTEPQSAAITLGKALNDPIKGITALTRVGVQFTEAQKNQIKAMTEAGDAAGAQGIILAEVERQFKGAAAAAADASPWRKAQVAIGQAMDVIGEAILPVIKPVAEAIASLARGFATLSPGMQKFVVIGGALAAALGPVLIGIGGLVSLLAPAIALFTTAGGALAGVVAAVGGLGLGLGAILAPIAAVAAAGYLIYQNWDKIAPVLEDLWQVLQETLGPPLQQLVGAISDLLSTLWNGPLGSAIQGAIAALEPFHSTMLKVFGATTLAAIKLVIDVFGKVVQTIADGVSLVAALFRGDWAAAATSAGAIIDRVFGGMPGRVVAWMAEMVTGIGQWVVDRLGAIWDTVKAKVDAVKGYFFGLYDAVVGNSYVPDMVDGIAAHMSRLDAVMVAPAKAATGKVAEAMRALADDTRAILDRLFPEVRQLLGYRADLATLDKAKLDPRTDAEARRRLGLELAGYATNDRVPVSVEGTGPLDVTRGLEEVLKSLDTLRGKAGVTTVAVAKSFQDMAQGVLASLDRIAGAVRGGGFLDILSAVVGLGLQLGGAGLFGSKVAARINAPKVPGYAGGTGFHPGGLALVGERGPELVDMPRGSKVYPNGTGPGGGTRVEVIPSAYFDVVVDGRIVRAAPAIMDGGAQVATSRLAQRQRRRVA